MRILTTAVLISWVSMLSAQDITGQWNGTLDVQGTPLSVIFNIDTSENGLVSTMDSPDQGAMNIPTSKTTFEDNELTIALKDMAIVYQGVFSAEDSTITGTFTQGSMAMPLVLTRKAVEKKMAVRPQDPTTFPYLQEEISFVNQEGHRLAGTLTVPQDKSFQRVVVLISGSGPQNRNEEVAPMNHRPFLVLSDYLTRHGIAVLRYDDRGIAASEGDFDQATSRDFADDVLAAVAFLQDRKDMKGKQIGLIGHSEGGMIAPIVASESDVVDFIVLLAGPGISIKELLILQSDRLAQVEKVPLALRKANLKIVNAAYDYLSTHKEADKNTLKEGLIAIFAKGYEGLPQETKEGIKDKEALFEQEADAMLTDWFLYFVNYDPAVYLRQVQCPILAINGGLDVQVPADENLAAIKTALKQGGKENFTIKKMKGQNHLFQKAKTGAVSEYVTLEETFNENTMRYIVDWIRQLL